MRRATNANGEPIIIDRGTVRHACVVALTCPNCGRQWDTSTARRVDGIAYCPECAQGPAYYNAPGWSYADRYARPILTA